MATQETVLRNLRAAVADAKTERGETGAMARVLAGYGYFAMPKISEGKYGNGSTMRIYAYHKSPAGDIALVTGPSSEGAVERLDDIRAAASAEGFYIAATTAKPSATLERQVQRAAQRAAGADARRAVAAPATKPKQGKPRIAVITPKTNEPHEVSALGLTI